MRPAQTKKAPGMPCWRSSGAAISRSLRLPSSNVARTEIPVRVENALAIDRHSTKPSTGNQYRSSSTGIPRGAVPIPYRLSTSSRGGEALSTALDSGSFCSTLCQLRAVQSNHRGPAGRARVSCTAPLWDCALGGKAAISAVHPAAPGGCVQHDLGQTEASSRRDPPCGYPFRVKPQSIAQRLRHMLDAADNQMAEQHSGWHLHNHAPHSPNKTASVKARSPISGS